MGAQTHGFHGARGQRNVRSFPDYTSLTEFSPTGPDMMIGLKRAIFPTEPRYMPGNRWLNVGLRTLHLVGIAGIGGGYFYASANDTWRLYQELCIISGTLLALLFIYSNGVWLLQIRGLVVLFKIALFYAIVLWPRLAIPLLILILVLSGWISHAPAKVRYYSPFFRRRIESLPLREHSKPTADR